MALSVVRTGNVALDRFLDEVRRKIDTLETSTSTTTVLHSGYAGGGGFGGRRETLTSVDLVKVGDIAREVTDSRLAQELRKPIDIKRLQGAAEDLRAEVRARIEQVRSSLIGEMQAGVDASLIVEINNRTAAIEAEAIARADAIAAEAHTRLLQVQEVAEAALDALTAVHQETTDRQAAVALARSDLTTYTDAAVSAEANQRTILAAQLLGADGTSNTTGLIYDERTARVAQDNALATQITLLSAGAGEQFDWKKIWYFDSGIESWTGNGTPTASGGWLRPANAGSNAYVESPTGMASDGSQYGQVRLRIRKAGSPTFAGYVWWRTAADSTWDASRRVALTAPTYDVNNIGLITVSPNWTGVIDRIRVDLSSAQDGTNYFEIDWVAVGRPSPGASSAQLLEEQTARAAADSAEVTARQTLSSKLTGLTDPSAATLASLTSGLMYDERTARTTADSAQVTSINNLQASLTTLDGEVTTLTSSVTTIETAVAELETTSASTTTEVISLGRTVDSELDQSAEALLRDIIATDNERKTRINEVALARTQLSTQIVEGLSAEATARTTLEARVGTAETAITTEQTARVTADTALANSITLLTADLGTTNAAVLTEQTARATADSALASDITSLEATVVANNTTLNAAITSEQTARATADTAIASDVTALTTRVGVTEAGILTEQTARSTADTAIASDLTALTTRVGDAEADILSEQTARASADSAIASDLTALTTRVGDAEADILTEQTARSTADTAIASDVTALTTRMGAAEADIISEATARASADSAQVTSINALTTRMGDAEADILSEQTARSTADSAQVTSINALTTRMGAAESAITTEQTARANGDSANATLITALTSRVGTAETDIAAVEITAGTAATKAGDLEGKYTVKVTAGGHVAGFGLASTSNAAGVGTSSFIVQADKFAVVPVYTYTQEGAPATPVLNQTWYKVSTKESKRYTASGWVTFNPPVPFAIDTENGKIIMQSDVSIDGNLLVTGTIGTSKLVATETLTNALTVSTANFKVSPRVVYINTYAKAGVFADNYYSTSDDTGSGRVGVVGHVVAGTDASHRKFSWLVGVAGIVNDVSNASGKPTIGVYGATRGGATDLTAGVMGDNGLDVPGFAGWFKNYSSTGYALRLDGRGLGINPEAVNTAKARILWGIVTVDAPPNNTTTFLRGDGQWAAPTVAWTSVSGKPSTFTPEAHTQDWSTITGKPSAFTPEAHNQDWSTITGKPSAFTPEAHNQGWTTIDGKPSNLAYVAAYNAVVIGPSGYVVITDNSYNYLIPCIRQTLAGGAA